MADASPSSSSSLSSSSSSSSSSPSVLSPASLLPDRGGEGEAGNAVAGEKVEDVAQLSDEQIETIMHEDEKGVLLPVDEMQGVIYRFIVRYSNKTMEVRLSTEDTVSELKAILYSLTDIPFERQKILGLVKGKVADNESRLSELSIPATSLRIGPDPTSGEKRITINLIGTPLDQTFKDPTGLNGGDNQLAAAEAVDIDYNDPASKSSQLLEPRRDPKALAKLRKAISRFSFTFPIMNEPRDELKGGLLVLDLDYTMVDTKRLFDARFAPHMSERPGLHEFLAAVYPYYDIVVWSQTTLLWLEAKLTEIGCLTHDQYKISFVLDRTPMFSVRSKPTGQPKDKHQVKALEIIWKRFPDRFGPHNTIHVDDLSRNFAMNPSCGLKIKAYHHDENPDRELIDLQEYLIKLAEYGLKSYEELGGHSRWKKLLRDSKKRDESR